jgi:hypothetical protein
MKYDSSNSHHKNFLVGAIPFLEEEEKGQGRSIYRIFRTMHALAGYFVTQKRQLRVNWWGETNQSMRP